MWPIFFPPVSCSQTNNCRIRPLVIIYIHVDSSKHQIKINYYYLFVIIKNLNQLLHYKTIGTHHSCRVVQRQGEMNNNRGI